MATIITVLGFYGILSTAIVYLVMHGHPLWAIPFALLMLCAKVNTK